VRKDEKKKEIPPEIANHWLNQWNRLEYYEDFYFPPRHREIRRRWTPRDGDYNHPMLVNFNPWALDVHEDDFKNELEHGINIQDLMKQAFRDGTVNPIDEPDPDDPQEAIIPEGCHILEFRPPLETEGYKEMGNPPVDPNYWK